MLGRLSPRVLSSATLAFVAMLGSSAAAWAQKPAPLPALPPSASASGAPQSQSQLQSPAPASPSAAPDAPMNAPAVDPLTDPEAPVPPRPPPYDEHSYESPPRIGMDDDSHYYAPRPPSFDYEEPKPPKNHAPKYSLWAGARVSLLAFQGRFYTNENGADETTGNFVDNGVAIEANVGARIAKRYLPYIFYERGVMAAGHRFAGEDASAHTDFYGVGFRSLIGDVDNISLVTDLSIGLRNVAVGANGQTYTMSSFEFFRIGLGAEIRLTSLFTLDPLISISGGSMSDTDGTVQFGKSGDGLTQPTYRNGNPIANETNYWVLAIGAGGHFDIFGK